MIPIYRRANSQPQGVARLDVGNPLARGIVAWQTGVDLNGFTAVDDGIGYVPEVVPTTQGISRYYTYDGVTVGGYNYLNRVLPTLQPITNTLVCLVKLNTDAIVNIGGSVSGIMALRRNVAGFNLYQFSADLTNPVNPLFSYETASGTPSPTVFSVINSTTVTPDDNWHLLIGRSISATSRDFWIDGVLQGSSTTSVTPYQPQRVIFGGTDSTAANGAVALSILYNRALTNAEIASISRNPWQIFAQQREYVPLPDPTRPGIASRPKIWTKQPQGNVEIDWGNPITRNLVSAFLPGQRYPFVDIASKIVDSATTRLSVGPGSRGTEAFRKDSANWSVSFNSFTRWTLPQTAGFPAISIFTLFEQFDTTSTGNIWAAGQNGTVSSVFIKENTGAISLQGAANDATTIITTPFTLDTNRPYAITGIIQTNYRELFVDGVSAVSSTSASTLSNSTFTRSTAGGTLNIGLFCSFVWVRRLTVSEIKSLTDNPWQIFAPQRTYVFPNPANLPIISRPNSDVTTTGWTPSQGSLLYPMINEVIPDNSTWIDSPVVDGSPGPAVMGMDNSLSTGTIIVKVRAKKLANTGRFRVILQDSSGNTVGTSSWQSVTSNIRDYALSVATSGTTARVRIEVAS